MRHNFSVEIFYTMKTLIVIVLSLTKQQMLVQHLILIYSYSFFLLSPKNLNKFNKILKNFAVIKSLFLFCLYSILKFCVNFLKFPLEFSCHILEYSIFQMNRQIKILQNQLFSKKKKKCLTRLPNQRAVIFIIFPHFFFFLLLLWQELEEEKLDKPTYIEVRWQVKQGTA